MACGGDVVPEHEGLGEIFAAFEPCAGADGSDDGHASRCAVAAEVIGYAGHERVLGPDDDEVDALRLDEASDGVEVARGQVDVGAYAGCSGIAGCDGESAEARALRHLPGQGVFASAGADQQYV